MYKTKNRIAEGIVRSAIVIIGLSIAIGIALNIANLTTGDVINYLTESVYEKIASQMMF